MNLSDERLRELQNYWRQGINPMLSSEMVDFGDELLAKRKAVKELVEALEKYGNHLRSCLTMVPREFRFSEIDYEHCDCGFDAAIAEYKETQ